ncbi:PhnD/SsuA/transferrin family substrate-binding protein [Shewanella sp. JM162201]|uniref:histidine kinase n=2 Tax=Shewanella jiangmenensis TaxID=2837387 RepID=A0ABS5V2Z2_9GAMM|nr:PhnD/SsuA/transferrin family substrate-binding protein [Shewanella jiangmenensis]
MPAQQGASLANVSASGPVRIGILSFADEEATLDAWRETALHLEQQLRRPVTVLALTPATLDAAVAAGTLDFFISNQFVAVGYKKDWGASQLLTLIPADGREPDKAVGSALVVRAGTRVNSWKALSSQRIVSSDPRAFGGFLIFAGEMAKRGLDPQADLPGLSFVGFPQTSLLSKLWRNEADVAILPACVMEQAAARGDFPPGTFDVVLAKDSAGFGCAVSSELYPYTALSKLGQTSGKLATQVAKALLGVEAGSRAALDGGYQGWSVPVNDNRVFALKHLLREWPFQTNWQRVANAAMPWLAAIGLGLLLGYLHHLRIKRLVVKRTEALVTEIDQHRATQKAFNEQQRQFYRAQRVLLTGEMASGISHELKQPLAGIRYLTQGCLYRLSEDESEIKTALGGVLSQVDRAQHTIDRLRSFCQQPSCYELVRVDKLILDTLSLIAPELKRLKLTPALELTKVKARLDPALMTQVLVNVLLNALDAMAEVAAPELKIVLDTETETKSATETDSGAGHCQYRIRIIDNGCGLTPAQLSRLFFPFESTKSDGLGLGMVICKRIVEEHGGSISASNRATADACGDIHGLEISICLPGSPTHA